MHKIYPLIQSNDFPHIQRNDLSILQVNLGYKCNQRCLHCHVNAGPNRTEMMDLKTIDHVINFLYIIISKQLTLLEVHQRLINTLNIFD